jgi:hypothetical protein
MRASLLLASYLWKEGKSDKNGSRFLIENRIMRRIKSCPKMRGVWGDAESCNGLKG